LPALRISVEININMKKLVDDSSFSVEISTENEDIKEALNSKFFSPLMRAAANWVISSILLEGTEPFRCAVLLERELKRGLDEVNTSILEKVGN
jgi:hypothetical protein